jgi:hypothetical protein
MQPTELPLRDIHLPPPVAWWPPAPGWWLLLALGVALCVLSIWLWRRLQRVSVNKMALRELTNLENDRTLSAGERVRRLSTLLRRAALSAYPRNEVAGLAGDEWLRFLDRHLEGTQFSQGPGRLLLDGPYRAVHDEAVLSGNSDALFAVCREWIARLPAGHS